MSPPYTHEKSPTKSFGYALGTNITTTAVSVLVLLFIPKIVGVAEYSYYQLYALYITYIGIFSLGWPEGIYLRNGGKYYSELNFPVLRKQFWLHACLQAFVCTAIIAYALLCVEDTAKQYVFISVAASIFLYLPQSFVSCIWQATNRLSVNALVRITDRLFFLFACVVGLALAVGNFRFFVLMDVAAKLLSAILTVWLARDFLFCAGSAKIQKELTYNIQAGSKLLIATISSMLINGNVRFAVEKKWGIEAFGKISFTLQLSNMFMVFIRAVSMALFPFVRRQSEEKLPGIYAHLRTLLMVPLLGLMAFYYPGYLLLNNWLPQYAESLRYMAMLLPVCLFESKMSMLVEVYLKTFRRENWLLWLNLTILGISLVCTGVIVFVLENVNLAVFSVLVMMALRSMVAEILLSRVISIKIKKNIVWELGLTAAFVIFNWFVGSWLGMALYIIAYIFYLFFHKKNILSTVKIVRHKWA